MNGITLMKDEARRARAGCSYSYRPYQCHDASGLSNGIASEFNGRGRIANGAKAGWIDGADLIRPRGGTMREGEFWSEHFGVSEGRVGLGMDNWTGRGSSKREWTGSSIFSFRVGGGKSVRTVRWHSLEHGQGTERRTKHGSDSPCECTWDGYLIEEGKGRRGQDVLTLDKREGEINERVGCDNEARWNTDGAKIDKGREKGSEERGH
ncbi:hypothetical protein CVT26_005670 [Gymnopilus dilepis]|uniref:Uncharacterized protein n=1 Tax=Gymnopilus dilepis TaxID=231916 RepID=A0A409XZZ7_9AGAR|nr:hypothetical protein CVT26_005670 [Gymnopilus dilepis]